MCESEKPGHGLEKKTVKRRCIDVPEMAESLTPVLLGLHAFTGCDSTSAFRGKGEVIPIKILLKSEKFKKAFSLLGSSWKDNDSFLEVMELFVFGP